MNEKVETMSFLYHLNPFYIQKFEYRCGLYNHVGRGCKMRATFVVFNSMILVLKGMFEYNVDFQLKKLASLIQDPC